MWLQGTKHPDNKVLGGLTKKPVVLSGFAGWSEGGVVVAANAWSGASHAHGVVPATESSSQKAGCRSVAKRRASQLPIGVLSKPIPEALI